MRWPLLDKEKLLLRSESQFPLNEINGLTQAPRTKLGADRNICARFEEASAGFCPRYAQDN